MYIYIYIYIYIHTSNIIWFNPPFSRNVSTNVAKKFLQLLDKHFHILTLFIKYLIAIL